MSRRLPTSRLAGLFLLLLAAALLSPLVAIPAAAFGEQVYESNTVISGTSHLSVYAGQSVAQSFTATASYRLLNVTLRLRNTGDTTDALNVTIRPDVGGVPSSTILSWAQFVISNTTVGNYNVPLSPAASLSSGTPYWIVATCASLVTNAYEWHHSASDTYPGGQAKVNLNLGGGWTNPASPTDLYFVNYGQETDANLSAAILAPAQANPGDLVDFQIFLNNTGNRASAQAWLNDTLLPGFTYVSDTAAAAGSTTPWPSFTFADVGNGPRSFDLVVRVILGTEPGTVLTKALSLAYVGSAGGLKTAPTVQGSVLIGLDTKQLYLGPKPVGSVEDLGAARPTGGTESQFNESLKRDGSGHDFDLDPVLAGPFRTPAVRATLYLDSGPHDARNLDINLTLTDWNGVTFSPIAYVQKRVTTNGFNDYQPFAFAFPGMDHTFPVGGRIRLTVRNMGTSGSDAILAMNSTFAASRLDLDTTTYVRVDRIDLRDARTSTTVWSPKDTLVVQANVSDPFGSSEITSARINLTAPSGTLLVNYTGMALLATDPGSPSAWKLFQFAYAPPLALGTYRATVTATESNGVQDIAEATALVRAAAFTLAKTATQTNVRSGDRFTYDIWFNNTGTGPAGRVWINDSLPSELTFLSSSDSGAMTGSYNWTWASLATGNYRLSIDVQVKGALPPTPYFRNYVFVNYTDEKGFAWPMRTAYADVAFRGPVISLTKTSVKSTIHANETIDYQILLQNTGDAAQTLWVNDTLPSGLAYVSNTAANIPGGGATTQVSGNLVYVRLTNMPGLSTWSFTLTAIAGTILPRGSVLTNGVALNYTNSNGFLMPPRSSSWTVTVKAPYIPGASVTIGRNQVTPSDVVSAAIAFTNVGNEAARDVWANLTLDPQLMFLNASVTAQTVGNDLRIALSNVGLGPRTIYVNASVRVDVADHEFLSINGTITYSDAYGNILPSVPVAPDGVEASVPRMVLSVTPGVAEIQPAGLVFYNIYQVNAGSGVAGDVWLTLPLPAGFVYVADTAGATAGSLEIVGSTYTWNWSKVVPGSKSFSLELRSATTVLNGTRANLTFHTDYTDANGNLRPGVTAYAIANFVAPQINLILDGTPREGRPGDTITFTLRMENLGGSEAHNVWVTTQIDPRFEVVQWTSRVQMVENVISGIRVLNWSFVDMQPQHEEDVTLILRIADGATARGVIALVFTAMYTNSGDQILGSPRSNVVTVTVAGDPLVLAWIGLASVGAGVLALLVVLRRLRVQIEEVFLVYRDGVLIYHLSRSLSQDKDEDVLSGMLTAVQEFVRDAFVYGEHRELHQLDFGDYRIMIERGKSTYLAVVYSGKGTAFVRKRVRSVLNHIETAYGAVLAKWDGDMDKVVGARDLIREYLLRPNGRRFKGLPGLP